MQHDQSSAPGQSHVQLPALIERDGDGSNAAVSITASGLEVVEAMAARGNSQKSIGAFLGISATCFNKQVRDDEAVALAWSRGKQRLEDELVGLLLAKARGGDTACIIYSTKALLGFSDQQKPQEERAPAITINLPGSMSEEAYLKMINITPEKADA
ncbi:MAG TPA: hypothetical protein PK417_08105 [Hyphomonas sp.]|nr:hypothetical protein [Hyphomonas sp.]